MKYILGLDIGGTNFRLGLVDRQLTAHRLIKIRPDGGRFPVRRFQQSRNTAVFQAVKPVMVCHTVSCLPVGQDDALIRRNMLEGADERQ